MGDGELRFSIAWVVETDIDIHVSTPGGSEISYDNPIADGGTLDVDDCVGGSCTSPGSTHVENVVFGDAASGTYQVWAVNYGGAGASVAVEIAVDGGDGGIWNDTLPASPGTAGPLHTINH